MDTQISRLMEQLCPKDGTWVPYSKFLAMFENGKPQEKKLHVELELHDAVDIKKVTVGGIKRIEYIWDIKMILLGYCWDIKRVCGLLLLCAA